jgi:hypothetical protein
VSSTRGGGAEEGTRGADMWAGSRWGLAAGGREGASAWAAVWAR